MLSAPRTWIDVSRETMTDSLPHEAGTGADNPHEQSGRLGGSGRPLALATDAAEGVTIARSHPGSGLGMCGAETGAKLCERAAHDDDGNHSPTRAHQHGDTAVSEPQRVATPS